MSEVIEIGKTSTKVRITHMRRSSIYFIENFLNWKLRSYHKEIIKRLEKEKERIDV